MVRRPNVFDKSNFEETLMTLGHPSSWASAVASDFKLLVPVVLQALGTEHLTEIITCQQEIYGLESPAEVWRESAKTMVQWAEAVLAEYAAQRRAGPSGRETLSSNE